MTSTSHSPSSSDKIPSVEPLYFEKIVSEKDSSDFAHLPAELLKHCLVDYCDWGDLAKLSTVSSSYMSVVKDAANQSHASKWELAQALLDGTHGLQASPQQAMSLLHELAGAELNDKKDKLIQSSTGSSSDCFTPAVRRMATCYLDGVGVEANASLGLVYLEGAYNLSNDYDAAHELGVIYELGKYGIESDVFLACEWFHKAAVGNHVEGMAEYGLCCELGCGREVNDEEALEWYMKAAEAGHVTANFSVGEAFEEARGVPQSDEEACLWYFKAAKMGDSGSKDALKRLKDIARIVLPGVGQLINA